MKEQKWFIKCPNCGKMAERETGIIYKLVKMKNCPNAKKPKRPKK